MRIVQWPDQALGHWLGEAGTLHWRTSVRLTVTTQLVWAATWLGVTPKFMVFAQKILIDKVSAMTSCLFIGM